MAVHAFLRRDANHTHDLSSVLSFEPINRRRIRDFAPTTEAYSLACTARPNMTKPGDHQGIKLEAYLNRFSDYQAGDIITGEDDRDTNIYFIHLGAVTVTHAAARGQAVWQSELRAGTMFGVVSALTGADRRAKTVAATDTRLAILTQDEFFNILQRDPEVAIWGLRELAFRLEEQTARIGALVSQSAC